MTDRLRDALESILAALLPRLNYYALWEYRVVTASPGPPVTVDARSLESTMPDLSRIELWPGPGGVIAVPAVGSRIRVGFINGDPSRPAVLGLDPEAPPTLTMVGGLPGSLAARVGDTVTITQAEINAAVMVAGGNPVTLTHPLVCLITSGSATVQVAP